MSIETRTTFLNRERTIADVTWLGHRITFLMGPLTAGSATGEGRVDQVFLDQRKGRCTVGLYLTEKRDPVGPDIDVVAEYTKDLFDSGAHVGHVRASGRCDGERRAECTIVADAVDVSAFRSTSPSL